MSMRKFLITTEVIVVDGMVYNSKVVSQKEDLNFGQNENGNDNDEEDDN